MRLGPTLLIALSLLPRSAPAQIDPQPDGFGLYFDTAATTNACATVSPDQLVTAYLCITRCSDSGGVLGWSCTLNWGELAPPAIVYTGNYTNLATPPVFVVATGTYWPIPWQPAITVASLTFVVPAPSHVTYFLIAPHPVWGLGYVSGSDGWTIYPLFVSSGSFSAPVAAINAAAPVATEQSSWGAVKALYR